MKYIAIWSICLLFVFNINGQERLSFLWDDTDLEQVINELEESFDFTFSYTQNLIDNQKISHTFKNATLEEILKVVCNKSNLSFEFFDESYVILKKANIEYLKLCGTLSDGDGQPISFANVYSSDGQYGTSSDDSGYFSFDVPSKSDNWISISFIGFQNKKLRAESLVNCPQIILKTKPYSFQEVQLKEYVTSGIESSFDGSFSVLDPQSLKMIPGLTDADVLQMIQLIPGVESIDESATRISIQGGTPDHNLILYDDIPIYNGGHFFGMLSAFNPNIVEKVSVYKGGFSSNFGGRISGVIDIRSIDEISDQISINSGVNFTHVDVSAEIPIIKNKLGLILGARKSYVDIIETPTYRKLSQRVFRQGKLEDVNNESEILDFDLGFSFSDLNAKIIYKPTNKDFLSISLFKIDDMLDFDFTDVEDDFETNDRLISNNFGSGFNWTRTWNKRLFSKLALTYTDLKNEYSFQVGDDGSDELEIENFHSNKIIDKTLKWDNLYDLNDALDLEFGVHHSNIDVRSKWVYDLDFEDSEEELNSNDIFSSYASLKIGQGKSIDSKVGIRWNRTFSSSQNYFEPRAQINYNLDQNLLLKMNAGIHHQFMNQVIEFNDLGLNQDFWVLADDDESTEVSRSQYVSMGFQYNPKAHFLELNAYYKKLDRLTSNLNLFDLDMLEEFESGEGRSWGFDLFVKKRWRNFESWISYSYSRTQYDFELEEQELNFRAPHDRPHSLSFTNQIKLDNWHVSFSWKLASGTVYTEATGFEQTTVDEAEARYDLNRINADRLPMYNRFDFSALYNVFTSDSINFKFGFSVLNAFNRTNILSREYFTIFNGSTQQFQLESRDRAMLGFTPNLVIRVQFN